MKKIIATITLGLLVAGTAGAQQMQTGRQGQMNGTQMSDSSSRHHMSKGSKGTMNKSKKTKSSSSTNTNTNSGTNMNNGSTPMNR